MIHQGKSSREIAEALGEGVTPEVVRQMAHRRGFKRPTILQRAGKALDASGEPLDLAVAIQEHRGIDAPHARPDAFVGPESVPKVAESYDAFNELTLRIQHPPYQLDVIKAILSESQVALVKGRQIGATRYVIAPAVVYFAFANAFSTVLLTSLTMRQSAYLLNHVKNLIAGSAALKPSLADVSQEKIRLTNGTEILSLPSGVDGASLRGYSPNLAVVDEAAFVPDRAIMDALLPSLAVTGGHIALVSTPWGIGSYFYRCAKENPAYRVFTIPSAQSPFLQPGFLEARALDTDPLSYKTEYMGEFVAAADAYFTFESIKACIRGYDLSDYPRAGDKLSHFVGVDWGKKIDQSVVSIVERDDSSEPVQLRLVHQKEFFQVPYTSVVGYIKAVAETFGAVKVLADIGHGEAQIDSLQAAKVPVEPFAFTSASKAGLMGNLKMALENRQLEIPDNRPLILELSNFTYDFTESGVLRLRGKHDDRVCALALACYAARTRSVETLPLFTDRDGRVIDVEAILNPQDTDCPRCGGHPRLGRNCPECGHPPERGGFSL